MSPTSYKIIISFKLCLYDCNNVAPSPPKLPNTVDIIIYLSAGHTISLGVLTGNLGSFLTVDILPYVYMFMIVLWAFGSESLNIAEIQWCSIFASASGFHP